MNKKEKGVKKGISEKEKLLPCYGHDSQCLSIYLKNISNACEIQMLKTQNSSIFFFFF